MIGRFCIVDDPDRPLGVFPARIAALGVVQLDRCQILVEHARTGWLILVDHSTITMTGEQSALYKRVARDEKRRAGRSRS